MREETRKRLDEVQRTERRGRAKALLAAALVGVCVAGLVFEPRRDVGTLMGTLRTARLESGDGSIPPHWDLWVTREDGGDVMATTRRAPPMLGERIVLIERRGFILGRRTYVSRGASARP